MKFLKVRRIVLLALMLAVASCVFAVTSFAADTKEASTELETKYGVIGEYYADEEAYPVVLFKYNEASVTKYSFVKGYSSFAEAAIAAGLSESGKNSVVNGSD